MRGPSGRHFDRARSLVESRFPWAGPAPDPLVDEIAAHLAKPMTAAELGRPYEGDTMARHLAQRDRAWRAASR